MLFWVFFLWFFKYFYINFIDNWRTIKGTILSVQFELQQTGTQVEHHQAREHSFGPCFVLILVTALRESTGPPSPPRLWKALGQAPASRSRALAPSHCAFCGLASVSLRKHRSLSEVLAPRPAGPAGSCSRWPRACTAGSALPGSCCCGLWSGRRERVAHRNHRNSTPGSLREWNLHGCPLPGTPKESEPVHTAWHSGYWKLPETIS